MFVGQAMFKYRKKDKVQTQITFLILGLILGQFTPTLILNLTTNKTLV